MTAPTAATTAPPSAPVRENAPTAEFLAAGRGAHRFLDPGRGEYRRFTSWFTRPLLSRPVILDAAETARLDHDLPALLRILQSLPERLFGGDQRAFAAAAGWTQPSAADVLDLLSGPAVPLGRADLVDTPDGFRLVEFNTSSSLGSLEFGELCRAARADPAFGDFAAQHGLYHLDPMALMARTLLESTGFGPDDRPTIALTDWTSSPVAVNASLFVELLTALGFPVIECTVADLRLRPDGVYAGERRIGVVYRTFLLKSAAEDPRAAELLRPLAEAVADGRVGLFSPPNADLFGAKACMAMLSDTRNRGRFTAGELEVADRTLPWTRSMTGAGAVSAQEAGAQDAVGGSLAEYVLRNRGDLVLKPSIGHAGLGVVAGWLSEDRTWAELVRAACAGDYVVQRRAHSVAERFASPDGEVTSCLHWGLFVTGAGLGGGFVKGLPDREQDIRFLGDGSHVGCVFHAPSPGHADLSKRRTPEEA
jgi:hypothetical protein